MTANAFDEDRRAAAACRMDGFLSKPMDIGRHSKLCKVFSGIAFSQSPHCLPDTK